MSATIVQKSTGTANIVGNAHYFECDDIFQGVVSDMQQQQQQQHSDHILDASMDQHVSDKELLHQQQQQQQLQQQQHQQLLQQHHRLHGPLTRTISQPAQRLSQLAQQQQQQQHQPPAVASLVTIIENLSNISLHRKLERTQSEPLPPQQPMNTSRYKTELCRPYEEAGECKYGEKCQFAHGCHELRNLQRHPKYKTEYCRTFHSVGFCPYGPRCHFVHNADEARAQQQQPQQQQQPHTAATAAAAGWQAVPEAHATLSMANPLLTTTTTNTNLLHYFLPLSPPLSMSTGSDRESPTGSLSLSGFATPPDSPNAPISPVHTPPPPTSQPHNNTNNNSNNNNNSKGSNTKQLLQKSISSPLQHEEAPRLPVFNRLSSTTAASTILMQKSQTINRYPIIPQENFL
ncbi:uncharacterized protein Dmoj_GI21684 [Drosophila mojavensis]|uniref:C3H1-type domain-containing protein n=1 Tax=Drosophila mojavensis TaxID=7230 RepID=B4L594_DROMO|nr:uncharacterized protein Dmoj_GI21684 [Drosophila mojavensis]